MARGNGKKDPIQQVVEQLVALRAELKSEVRELRDDLNERFTELGTRLDVTTTRLEVRLDKVIDNTGGHYRKLEERVSALEAKVL